MRPTTLTEPNIRNNMQQPTQDVTETRVMPSPNKEVTNNTRALVFARILAASNPQAFHRYAEAELSAWIQANLPEKLLPLQQPSPPLKKHTKRH